MAVDKTVEVDKTVAVDKQVAELLASCSAEIRQLALEVRALVRDAVPDATEDLDPSSKLIGFTYLPGTYKGLFAAVAPHRAHVNLMFSKGVELLELDTSGLLEGTGKSARHIRFADSDRLSDPTVRTLVQAAAQRTPRR